MAVKSVLKKFDGWVSSVLAFGTGRDKLGSLSYLRPAYLPDETLEALYLHNALAAKIIDLMADDVTREGIDIEDEANEDALEAELERIKAMGRINQGIKYARIFGGAAVYIEIDDGLDPSEPVDLAKGAPIRRLVPIEARYINPWPVYEPYKEPVYYSASGFDNAPRIHASRLMIFFGIYPTERERQRRNGWGLSILQRLYEALKNYGLVTNASATIMTDFTRSVYKLSGLNELLLMGNDEAIVKKLTAMEDGASMLNANVLDSEDNFEKKTTSVAGLADLMKSAERRLLAESDMPHTMLFGEAPGASLGEAGAGQKRDYYDRIKYYQENCLAPELNKLMDIVAASIGAPYPVPYEFESLWQETEAEKAKIEKTEAETKKIEAETDKVYIDSGVLLPEQVYADRFGPEEMPPVALQFDYAATAD